MLCKNRSIKRKAVIPSEFNDLATMLYPHIHLLIVIHTVYSEAFSVLTGKEIALPNYDYILQKELLVLNRKYVFS